MLINIRSRINTYSRRIGASLMTALFAATVIASAAPSVAQAAVTNAAPQAKVSFTFDDGYSSALTAAAPVLQKYGFTGTDYVITNCVDMTTAPNTCAANTSATYMSWAQIAQLQATYGWEIGSHTSSHPYLATSDPVQQPLPLTLAQASAELTQSKATLAAHGIDAVSFAPPYGDYNMQTLAEIAKSYGSMRGFQDTGYNTWPYNEYLVRDQHVEGNTSVATVKTYVDAAIANNQWLVLTFHNIKRRASANVNNYEYSTANLDAIAAYVKSKNVPVVNVKNAFVKSDTNMFQNGNMSAGLTAGWTTDAASNVVADATNNGSYPEVAHSIRMTAGTQPVRLFAPTVPVATANQYIMSSYLNVQSLMSGEVSYYIDEYDGLGNWISGQYKTSERSIFAENIALTYTPSSSVVRSARLQLTVSPNSNITAYVDNFQMFNTVSSTVVTPVSLVDGSFDTTMAAAGWTTDAATAFEADAANHGSSYSIVNSLKMTAGASTAHLFSKKVTVTSSKSYTVAAYVNALTMTSGEVGFYIDEYDASGNWISGQYKGGVRNTGPQSPSFTYVPSSANVSTASVQVILVGGSTITGYIDDIRWY